jgi:3-hydroxyacyl-[acyl-carrier-protein] dehydratase
MRFLMVDRVVSIEPGKRIETLKLPSLGEEYLRGHFTRKPLVPGALLLEAIAQSLGWLINVTHDYAVGIVLGALDDAQVVHDLAPGHPVTIVGELLSTSSKGSVGRATATADGRTVASVGRMLYAQFPHPDPAALRARFRSMGGTP